MPITQSREYRDINALKAIESKDSTITTEPSYVVEGYAATFDSYPLYTDERGNTYSELIDRAAFNGTDTSDVIMQYDHAGMVMARTANNTLDLTVDDHGLKVRADLGSTAQSRELYEAIASGLITKMSFAFTVDDDDYDDDTNTRNIRHIKKLYDVSAVSYPANPGTEIGLSARDVIDGLIDGKKQERLKAEQAIKKLMLKIKIMEA